MLRDSFEDEWSKLGHWPRTIAVSLIVAGTVLLFADTLRAIAVILLSVCFLLIEIAVRVRRSAVAIEYAVTTFEQVVASDPSFLSMADIDRLRLAIGLPERRA